MIDLPSQHNVGFKTFYLLTLLNVHIMGLQLQSFIKLDSEGDRICFIIVLTAAQCL